MGEDCSSQSFSQSQRLHWMKAKKALNIDHLQGTGLHFGSRSVRALIDTLIHKCGTRMTDVDVISCSRYTVCTEKAWLTLFDCVNVTVECKLTLYGVDYSQCTSKTHKLCAQTVRVQSGRSNDFVNKVFYEKLPQMRVKVGKNDLTNS